MEKREQMESPSRSTPKRQCLQGPVEGQQEESPHQHQKIKIWGNKASDFIVVTITNVGCNERKDTVNIITHVSYNQYESCEHVDCSIRKSGESRIQGEEHDMKPIKDQPKGLDKLVLTGTNPSKFWTFAKADCSSLGQMTKLTCTLLNLVQFLEKGFKYLLISHLSSLHMNLWT